MSRKVAYLVAAALWIALCSAAFVLLDDAPDPSRRTDRILSNDAGRIALAAMRRRDRARFRDYEVVHVAHARRLPWRDEPQWVVLLDCIPHSGLSEAVVVELRAADGAVVNVRAAK
jgi:hypothetical protein